MHVMLIFFEETYNAHLMSLLDYEVTMCLCVTILAPLPFMLLANVLLVFPFQYYMLLPAITM